MASSTGRLLSAFVAASFAALAADAAAQFRVVFDTSAHQQVFAWICSDTLAIGATLGPESCAWSAPGGANPLVPGSFGPPFGEAISAISAGDPDRANLRLMQLVSNELKSSGPDGPFALLAHLPLTPLNLDRGPDPPCPVAGPDADPPGAACELWDGARTALFAIGGDAGLDPTGSTHAAVFTGENLELVRLLRGPDDTGNIDYTVLPDGTEAAIITSTCRADRVLDSTHTVRGFRQWVDLFGDGTREFPQKFRSLMGIFGPLYDPSPSGICPRSLFEHDPGDLATLDGSLTAFQEALLGCGPFFGTRCDSAEALEVLPTDLRGWATPADYNAAIEPVASAGGGLDPAAAEAGALMQSWPSGVVSWTTLGVRRQPGTARVVDPLPFAEGGSETRVFGPACGRPDGQGGWTALPGCRGIEAIHLTRDPQNAVTSVGIAFDDGYDPSVDGCLVGGGAARFSPQAIGHLGGEFDAETGRFTGRGGVDVVLVPNANGYQPDAAQLELCHTRTLRREIGYGSDSQEFVGSDWLWHPLAGCLPDDANAGDPVQTSGECGTVMVDGIATPRSFTDRFLTVTGGGGGGSVLYADFDRNSIIDIEEEFLGSLERADCTEVAAGRCGPVIATAQMFANELAAASWNFLTFLVTTSCSAHDDGADAVVTDPRCFDPGQVFRADKCSFNAPHLCHNVRSLLDEGVIVEIDVERGFGRGRSTHRVTVTVLGSDVIPVDAIDPASLAFGPAGAAPADPDGPRYGDVNGDGFADLVSRYRVRETGLGREEEEACLAGTIAGFSFEGCDRIAGRRDREDDDGDGDRARRDREDDDEDGDRELRRRRDDDDAERGRGERADRRDDDRERRSERDD